MEQEAVTAIRGVSPSVLRTQIRNTIPFLFERAPGQPFLKQVLEVERDLSHSQYFRLCLSAHYATVASFVPTDVDNQIRFKLWHPSLEPEALSEMIDTVLEAREWDSRVISKRWVQSPASGEVLSGHHGEWLSAAVAAYAASRRRLAARSEEMAQAIVAEVIREAQVFTDLKSARDGLGILKASTLIAHNLGDLDRVIEMWNLPDDDALKNTVFKAGVEPGLACVEPGLACHESGLRLNGAENSLLEAGKLNKAHMAIENHRHIALRSPKCLRRSADLLLPLAPFFDGWGMTVARHPALSPEDVSEVVQALVAGWERLQPPPTVGYPRALAGIFEAFPGGLSRLSQYLPARVERNLKAGLLRSLISVPQRRFEDQWAQFALGFLKSLRKY